ncbi:MAG: hypothetical protein ACRDFX_09285 [Chloroflexota bacterium]
MNFEHIRLFIQRLFADPALRRDFLQTPERVLGQYVFGAGERRALLRLRARLVANGHTVDLHWP